MTIADCTNAGAAVTFHNRTTRIETYTARIRIDDGGGKVVNQFDASLQDVGPGTSDTQYSAHKLLFTGSTLPTRVTCHIEQVTRTAG